MQWYVNFVNVIFVRLICIFKPSSSSIDEGRTIQKYSFVVDNVPGFLILFSTLHFVHDSNNCNLKSFILSTKF